MFLVLPPTPNKTKKLPLEGNALYIVLDYYFFLISKFQVHTEVYETIIYSAWYLKGNIQDMQIAKDTETRLSFTWLKSYQQLAG